MPSRPCPICQHDAPRLVESLAEISLVIYYRCDACGHVWHIPKNDPDGPPVAVTESIPAPTCPVCLEREARTVLLHSDGEPHTDWHCDECYTQFARRADGTLERKPAAS